MGIKRSFGGASIRKPGAYSISKVDLSGGAPLGDNGTLMLVGEASKGAPGDTEGLQVFSSAQMPNLIEEFGDGAIVDMARAALTPAQPGQGIGGADTFIVWKTNSSTQAELDLENGSAVDLFKLKDRNFGVLGNQIAATVSAGSSPEQKQITIERGDEINILPENDAKAQIQIQYTGGGNPVTLTISGATESAKTLVSAITGGAASEDLDIDLKDFTMKTLAEFINANSGWTATLQDAALGAITPATDLDPVTAIDVLSAPVDLLRAQEELMDIVNEQSPLALMEKVSNVVGQAANLTKTFFLGGALGSSANSDFADGYAASLATDWNVSVPGVSQDASADILLGGITDASSAYTIASVTASLNSHLILRGNVKNRREAQGMVGRREAVVQTAYDAASTLGSALIQMWIEDVLVQDVNADLTWKQPHVMGAVQAGIRLGSEVGEPLTHKFANISGKGHVVDADTGISGGDFVPETDFDPAIDAGVSFLEQVAGGFRCVVDNTTYGKDQSFVFNRGSVVEASQFIAKTLRETAELVFVGQKVANGTADSIKSVLRSKLVELNDARITTASDGAPQGFEEETFTVTIVGNTATVQVKVIPVQGLDFIFIEFTLGDIRQSA